MVGKRTKSRQAARGLHEPRVASGIPRRRAVLLLDDESLTNEAPHRAAHSIVTEAKSVGELSVGLRACAELSEGLKRALVDQQPEFPRDASAHRMWEGCARLSGERGQRRDQR